MVRRRLRFGFSASSRHGGHFFAGGALDTSGFSTQVAQVVEAGATDFAFTDHFNRADRRRMERENALDADAKAHATHGKRGTGGTALLGDDDPFERLEAFLFLLAFAFLQADVEDRKSVV